MTADGAAAVALSAPLLAFRDVSCVRDGREVLRGVTFEVAPGEIVGLAGPNGAGKSTLLACAAGHLEFSGAVACGDAAVALVPQSAHADANLPISVLEFVVASSAKRPVLFGISRSAAERAHALLAEVGLGDFASRQIRRLSTGEWKRCLLAGALFAQPRVLLLDEVDAGLDAPSMARLHSVLQGYAQRGGAVLWATHDVGGTASLITRTLKLSEGRVVT